MFHMETVDLQRLTLDVIGLPSVFTLQNEPVFRIVCQLSLLIFIVYFNIHPLTLIRHNCKGYVNNLQELSIFSCQFRIGGSIMISSFLNGEPQWSFYGSVWVLLYS